MTNFKKMIGRKTFIKSIAMLGAFSVIPNIRIYSQAEQIKNITNQKKLYPKRLQHGDVIGLITPGSPITDNQLKNAVKQLKDLGYKTYYKLSVLSEYGYFAGTDQDRAAELMLGYSDITALLTSIYERTGLICFHGPMGISDFNNYTLNSFNKVLTNPKMDYKYPYLREANTLSNAEFDFYTINKGKAEGELIGGNLSVLASMAGSNFSPNFENKIVFLEEIEEKTYRVDRMLTQLVQATNIRKAKGIVLGIFYKCNINSKPTLTLKQAISDILRPLNLPAAYGFPFGHIETKMTIPTGIIAKFNATKRILKLTEKTVS